MKTLAPTLGELAAKPTERVKIALSASGTSPIGRGKWPLSVTALPFPKGSIVQRVVLRAANQNYHDCRWQSYHNVLLAKIFDF